MEMELEKAFASEKNDEEASPLRPAAKYHETGGSGTNGIDISDGE